MYLFEIQKLEENKEKIKRILYNFFQEPKCFCKQNLKKEIKIANCIVISFVKQKI